MKMLKRKTVTEACPTCDSTSPRAMKEDGRTCANERTCNERRCRRRQREDDARGVREQCHATTGQRSIRFCELRVGHTGLHLNGTIEWAGREAHPLAMAIREGLSVREPKAVKL